MQITLNQPELAGEEGTEALFGGNILAPRAEMTGENSYAEAISDLGVTGLRYPGGSLTEYYFDISNPDADTATSADTGETTDFIPISDFMEYAEEAGHAVTIVIPTRDQLSEETDANGDRLNAIDEETLRDFVHDVVTGVYGDADVAAFEIGNEYWGSGEMNATEYGRLAAEMSTIIDSELTLISEVYGEDTSNTKVLVQMGENYGTSRLSDEYDGWDAEDIIDDLQAKYPDADITDDNIRGSGEVNWTEVNNELVQMSFDTPEEQGAIDGIVAHVYSKGPEADNSKFYDLDTIDNTWLQDAGFEDLDVFVTEWNLKSTTGLEKDDDYGLYQAHEMLNIVESFMSHGVDAANVWPLIQNTSNTMSWGFDYSGATVPAEMFSMMSENIPGKTMLDFTPGTDRETQLESQDVHLHGFAGDDEVVFYIASVSDETTTSEIDISGLIQSYGEMEIQVLGVAEGEDAGSTRSEAKIQTLSAEDVYKDGTLTATLDTGEIMQVVIRDVEPTADFAEILAAANGETEDLVDDGTDSDTDTPDQDVPDDDSDDAPVDEDADTGDDQMPEEEDDDDDGGSDSGSSGFADLGWLLALLPFLALVGL